jgi:hypothetical protein
VGSARLLVPTSNRGPETMAVFTGQQFAVGLEVLDQSVDITAQALVA